MILNYLKAQNKREWLDICYPHFQEGWSPKIPISINPSVQHSHTYNTSLTIQFQPWYHTISFTSSYLETLHGYKRESDGSSPGFTDNALAWSHGSVRLHQGAYRLSSMPELHFRKFLNPIIFLLLTACQCGSIPATVPLCCSQQWWCRTRNHH